MKKVIYGVMAISILIASCKKKGCTDSDATNYSSEAKKDDGTCVYPEVINTVVDINSTQQYSFSLDGSVKHGVVSSVMSQGYSSSSGNGGDVLGSFFYDVVADYSPLVIERGVKPYGVMLTDSQLENLFQVGSQSYSDNSSDVGFKVSIEESSGAYYSSVFGSQNNSDFEIVSVQNDNSGGKLYIKALVRFNCNLYNENDLSDVKTLTDGEAVLYFTDY